MNLNRNQNKALREYDRAIQAPRWHPLPEPEENSRDKARRRLRAQFDLACPDPNPMDTVEAAARANHSDVDGLSLDEISRERILLKIRWALTSTPSQWLTERLARLDGEAAVRRPAPRRR